MLNTSWCFLYKIKQQYEEEYLISKLEYLSVVRIRPCNFLPSLNGQEGTYKQIVASSIFTNQSCQMMLKIDCYTDQDENNLNIFNHEES